MTPIEAAAAARELAQRFQLLAELDVHPTTNAVAIHHNRAECYAILEQLTTHLLFDADLIDAR